LNDRLENQEETQNSEQNWQNIKTAILEAAKETIQMQPRTTYNDWWDEECKEAIKGKNIARKNVFNEELGLLKKNTRKKDA
jgi:post-segregation antitoxin (ccd killing protein)